MNEIDASVPIRAKRGEEQAFIEIVDFYYPRCLRFARNMLQNDQDAEEAVQDAFVRECTTASQISRRRPV